MEHLVDLDGLASRLLPDLQRWQQSVQVGPVTWRDENAEWPQPIVDDRSAVEVPESLGLRLWHGSDEFEIVIWTGGWVDAGSFVEGELEQPALAFADEDEAYEAMCACVEAFISATLDDGP
ncbi:hypothetical protein ACTJKO_05480 [Curtobacterium sp. 22159]|uniref:hypothetical protein n=1 Tax=Curtobacterium sp. 22159 TaxID=3453882 RepID=UPI003F87E258